MERVTGIGGVFFRARDPAALGRWYETHLGIDVTAGLWLQDAGPTVLAPFPADTEYFRGQWMINFRVADLDAMLRQLAAAGIAAETRPEWDSEAGRFARIHDPEGNPVELWEPPPQD